MFSRSHTGMYKYVYRVRSFEVMLDGLSLRSACLHQLTLKAISTPLLTTRFAQNGHSLQSDLHRGG